MPPKTAINSEKPKPKPKYTPDSDLSSSSGSDDSYSDSDESEYDLSTENSDSDTESKSLKGGKITESDDEEEEENEDIDEIEELKIDNALLNDSTQIPEKNRFVYGDERISKPFLTKYEYVRLLGDRTKQLIEGAKPMIKNVSNMSAQDIAREEIKLKVIPLIIIRPMPDGTKEKWFISEFQYTVLEEG
jgi:DNA-directed RNA polymerase I, II, and III subunit RPABC2